MSNVDVPDPAHIVHATTISVDGRGLIIHGPSGSGKSALALQLIALGATLVADDRTLLSKVPTGLVANCPPAIQGLIEARGFGLLELPFETNVQIYLAVDLAQTERERLPKAHTTVFLGHSVKCFHKCDGPHFAAALLIYLKNVSPLENG